jgi:hypothetical protein
MERLEPIGHRDVHYIVWKSPALTGYKKILFYFFNKYLQI